MRTVSYYFTIILFLPLWASSGTRLWVKYHFSVSVAAGYKYTPSLILFQNVAFPLQPVKRSAVISGVACTFVIFWGEISHFFYFLSRRDYALYYFV